MTVDIQYTRAAEKFFTQHEDVRAQYETAILKLVAGEHPESVDVKKIQGKRNDYYRIRIGGYRVIYAGESPTYKEARNMAAYVYGDV
ncbi:MAG: hypothetical protein K6E42_05150, partial [Synergistes sp.]|nr:hypothetical protein [Synergistes sp.]